MEYELRELPGDLHRRAGGLEKILGDDRAQLPLHRRAGGLEN